MMSRSALLESYYEKKQRDRNGLRNIKLNLVTLKLLRFDDDGEGLKQ